jgi:hypothetical protein
MNWLLFAIEKFGIPAPFGIQTDPLPINLVITQVSEWRKPFRTARRQRPQNNHLHPQISICANITSDFQ